MKGVKDISKIVAHLSTGYLEGNNIATASLYVLDCWSDGVDDAAELVTKDIALGHVNDNS